MATIYKLAFPNQSQNNDCLAITKTWIGSYEDADQIVDIHCIIYITKNVEFGVWYSKDRFSSYTDG